MNQFVIDTQALIMFLNGRKVVNDKADQIMKMTDLGENIIVVPAVVFFEIGYLFEKRRIPFPLQDIENSINDAYNYREEKLSFKLIKTAFEITDIPELHDRLIAGTARHLNLSLITNDPVIRKSQFVHCVE